MHSRQKSCGGNEMMQYQGVTDANLPFPLCHKKPKRSGHADLPACYSSGRLTLGAFALGPYDLPKSLPAGFFRFLLRRGFS